MRTTMATENNNKTLNVPNLRFPTELWESQIWNIEDFSSRILINIRWNF